MTSYRNPAGVKRGQRILNNTSARALLPNMLADNQLWLAAKDTELQTLVAGQVITNQVVTAYLRMNPHCTTVDFYVLCCKDFVTGTSQFGIGIGLNGADSAFTTEIPYGQDFTTTGKLPRNSDYGWIAFTGSTTGFGIGPRGLTITATTGYQDVECEIDIGQNVYVKAVVAHVLPAVPPYT
jgi:hypothetical protein